MVQKKRINMKEQYQIKHHPLGKTKNNQSKIHTAWLTICRRMSYSAKIYK